MKSALDHKKVRLARLVAESKADSSRKGLKVQSPRNWPAAFTRINVSLIWNCIRARRTLPKGCLEARSAQSLLKTNHKQGAPAVSANTPVDVPGLDRS